MAVGLEGGPPAVMLAQARGHGGGADAHNGGTTKAPAAASQAGEAGESGSASDATLEPALRFYRDIQLIRGHLLVGDELVKEGRWAEALPHFLHPSEEIYGKIRGELNDYNVPAFLTALKALAQTVKAKNKEAYAGALATVEQRLAPADTTLRKKEANWSYFAMETALEALRTATAEYEQALKDGKIANPVEYQDSRGFVWQAERLFASVADDLTKKDADATAAVRAAFADLKLAWPSPLPPKAPAKDLSQVLSDVSKIELQLGRFR
jgi:tetratricopeptide (TPR) repeat protein